MANRTIDDLPVTTVVAAADKIHCRQSTTDKSVTQAKIAEYVQTLSDYAPTVVTVTGTTHTVSTTIRKQLIICTIAANCTFTFPGSFGNAKEIIVRNESGSAANVLGLPNSEVLYPGSEITFIWNGTAWIKRTFSTNLLTGTAAPSITPSFIGQTFVDGTNDNIYIATGTGSSADWTKIQNQDLNVYSGTGLTISDTDSYDKYISAHTTSTGLQQFDLPTLADNLGKRYLFQNKSLGLTYINSEEGSNILFKDYTLSKMIMVKSGDKLTVLATATGWLVEDYYMCIESGWYNRSDWTNVYIGFANFDYDTKSGGTGDMTGEKYVLASGVSGVILNDSAPAGAAGTLTVAFVTGTGLALNNEVGTCGSGQTFAVNEGTGDNKDQDHYLTHNLVINYTLAKFAIIYNTTASYTNSWIFDGSASQAGSNFGITKVQIDNNNLGLHTQSGGFVISNMSTGVGENIVSNNSYCNIILEISA